MGKQSTERRAIIKQTSSESSDQEEHSIVTMQEISGFSGPLPHPEILSGYEKVLPGSADRILCMAEDEARHRRALETKASDADSRDSLLGIISATIISVSALIVGCIIVVVSHTTAGAVAGSFFGVSGISGIVIAMINGTRKK